MAITIFSNSFAARNYWRDFFAKTAVTFYERKFKLEVHNLNLWLIIG